MTEKKADLVLSDEVVLSKIYYVRGHKMMLDKDLAEMYNVQPIRLREQVKRNADRFPETFMFQLSDNEIEGMVSQFAIPSRQHLGGYLPYVFTEHGVLMLASVLRSKIAMQVSVRRHPGSL
ncbi:MAG TPA: ORF6N domain-containing protein [Puia sp.]